MKHFFHVTITFLVCVLFTFIGCFPLFFIERTRPFAGKSIPMAKAETTSQDQPPQAGDYACILSEDTFFYDSPNESRGLFLLPATYYVKLLDYATEYSRVEYHYDDAQTKKLVGYVKTNHLTFVNYIPKRPYFFYAFSLSYKIEDASLRTSDILNEIVIDCTYYGDYKIGSQTYCYVLRGESFGYVPKPANLTVPKNTEYEDYLSSLNASSAIEPPPKEEETATPAQIAILVALCLLIPVLAALILKPPRRPPYETDPE